MNVCRGLARVGRLDEGECTLGGRAIGDVRDLTSNRTPPGWTEEKAGGLGFRTGSDNHPKTAARPQNMLEALDRADTSVWSLRSRRGARGPAAERSQPTGRPRKASETVTGSGPPWSRPLASGEGGERLQETRPRAFPTTQKGTRIRTPEFVSRLPKPVQKPSTPQSAAGRSRRPPGRNSRRGYLREQAPAGKTRSRAGTPSRWAYTRNAAPARRRIYVVVPHRNLSEL